MSPVKVASSPGFQSGYLCQPLSINNLKNIKAAESIAAQNDAKWVDNKTILYY